MDSHVIEQWILGLVLVSGLIGLFLSYLWYWMICKVMGVRPKYRLFPLPKPWEGHTGLYTGIMERFFFTVLIATNMTGIAIAIIAWIVFKGSNFWTSFTKENPKSIEQKEPKRFYVGVMTSLGSMLIAIVGAQICKGAI